MKIALFQMQMSDDVAKNYQKSIAAIKDAARDGADIILFPELQFCKFFPQFPGLEVKHLALEITDEKIRNIQKICRELKIAALPNFYLKENEKYFDASAMISADGEILGLSKMVHIASAKQFYEQDYYAPSDSGFITYQTKKAKVGVVICFDRHYPESIRKCAIDGAEIILIPTANTKAENMELFAWEMRVAAYKNNVFIVMCNRCGKEDEMDFAGESIICNPDGDLIYKACDQEKLIVENINISDAKNSREKRNYISLMRKEWY